MNLCRICLKIATKSNSMLLFKDNALPSKIEAISSIKMEENNHLPSRVCTQCILNIHSAFNFRLLIITNDLNLHHSLGETLKRNQEKCEEVKVNNAEEAKSENFKGESGEKIEVYIRDAAADEEQYKKDNIIKTKRVKTKKLKGCHPALDKSETSPIEENNTTNQDLNEPVKVYQCQIDDCHFETTNYKQFVYHRISYKCRPSICSICGKSVLRQNMAKHKITHSGTPVNCPICGSVSKSSVALRSHMLYHKGEHVCHICGKTYRHSSRYAEHVRLHTTPRKRNHKCHLCDKSFAESDTLRRHIRSHTGERPYPCQYCKKGFSSPHALKTHIRQHTKETPYSCSLCSMSFRQRVSLRTHMKSKHKTETVNQTS